MAEQKEKILTPEEYYQQAYDRITSIGKAIKAAMSKEVYEVDANYQFQFDKTAVYRYIGVNAEQRHSFKRQSDSGKAILGKYNTIDPIKL